MKSIGSIFIVLMLILIVFTAMVKVGEETVTNSNLQTESVILIANVEKGVNNNINYSSSFNEFSSGINASNNFDGQDVYAQEYLEGKGEGRQKQGLIATITTIPDLFILSLGVPQDSVIWIKGIVALIISVMLSFASYRAFFGGGKITDN